MENPSRSAHEAYASVNRQTPFHGFGYSWHYLLLLVPIYPLLASTLRFRRIDAVQKKYGYSTREQMSKMTDSEAHEILKIISELEFPAMFEKGLQLALFRSTCM